MAPNTCYGTPRVSLARGKAHLVKRRATRFRSMQHVAVRSPLGLGSCAVSATTFCNRRSHQMDVEENPWRVVAARVLVEHVVGCVGYTGA